MGDATRDTRRDDVGDRLVGPFRIRHKVLMLMPAVGMASLLGDYCILSPLSIKPLSNKPQMPTLKYVPSGRACTYMRSSNVLPPLRHAEE